MRTTLTLLLAASAALAAPAAADTVISGKSAQALRCAAYIGMAAQYGYDEGYVSARERDLMSYWSTLVLERWVPLSPEATLAAYGTALRELGSRYRTYALIARHSDWCLTEFSPSP
jgi:hypothetical protein